MRGSLHPLMAAELVKLRERELRESAELARLKQDIPARSSIGQRLVLALVMIAPVVIALVEAAPRFRT